MKKLAKIMLVILATAFMVSCVEDKITIRASDYEPEEPLPGTQIDPCPSLPFPD